jgi:DNA (cytosine-5)-methyltransferase 1
LLNGLDLFSGIGGITLALGAWVRPLAYCENDRYAQAVLLSRMSSNEITRAPIWDDVRTLAGSSLPSIDIIYGGFPCQDISAAGIGVGLGGERSRLFFEIVRLTEELSPRFVFLENVPAIRTRGLKEVVSAFADLRYDCRWTCVSAAEVGACHLRKRWFMLAYAHGSDLRPQSGRSRREKRQKKNVSRVDGSPRDDSDANGPGLESLGRSESGIARPVFYNGWVSQPTVRRRDNGIQDKSHRLKALGNSVVPLQAQTAFKRLCGLK